MGKKISLLGADGKVLVTGELVGSPMDLQQSIVRGKLTFQFDEKPEPAAAAAGSKGAGGRGQQ